MRRLTNFELLIVFTIGGIITHIIGIWDFIMYYLILIVWLLLNIARKEEKNGKRK